jgi:3-hydroxyacyl-[acyl-carrier-protein] dehydratase
MRWLWIDRFVEFESGRRAVAYKNTSLTEDHNDDYQPSYGIVPASTIIEGLAQTGGLLIGEHSQFHKRVVLAKVAKAVFHDYTLAGTTLTYTAEVEDIQLDGAFCQCQVLAGDEVRADIQLMFAHLDDRFPENLFEPAAFLRMLRLFELYKVGRTKDGKPLTIPEHLLSAERMEAERLEAERLEAKETNNDLNAAIER